MGKKSQRPPVRGVNPVEAMMNRAADVDRRRRAQIDNQIAAINRLAAALHHEAPWTYTDEMKELHQQLAAAQADRNSALERVRELKEESMGRRKDAFYAGFEAGETEDSVDAAWEEYKEANPKGEPADSEDDGDADGE